MGKIVGLLIARPGRGGKKGGRKDAGAVSYTHLSRVPTLCADGKVRYAERTETRVVEIPPRISDVNRAADLLGRRCGLWSERTEAAGSDVRIVDDVRCV